MYFDDCERRPPFVEDWEGWLPELNSRVSWTTSRAKAKHQAIQQLLGYNFESASQLSIDQVELETLQWVADCNIVWAPDDYDDDPETTIVPTGTATTTNTSRYASVADLIVASNCHSNVDCLAFLWDQIAKMLERQELNSVYMIVFPNATSLWDYDGMVTTLQALAISKPLLPVPLQNLQLDLFHPDYKHSPRMWSPEMHSPFPTLGLSIQKTQPPQKYPTLSDNPRTNSESVLNVDDELETARSRLESLFANIDADDNFSTRLREMNMDPRAILKECISWRNKKAMAKGAQLDDEESWVVDTHVEPFQLYASLWLVVQRLQEAVVQQTDAGTVVSSPSMMLVVPNLDSYTTKRVAITVNVALQRLQSTVRVSDIFYPTASLNDPRNAPYAMIQVSQDTNSRVL
jgi:hypothetical protein